MAFLRNALVLLLVIAIATYIVTKIVYFFLDFVIKCKSKRNRRLRAEEIRQEFFSQWEDKTPQDFESMKEHVYNTALLKAKNQGANDAMAQKQAKEYLDNFVATEANLAEATMEAHLGARGRRWARVEYWDYLSKEDPLYFKERQERMVKDFESSTNYQEYLSLLQST